jgi:hypothetical protein
MLGFFLSLSLLHVLPAAAVPSAASASCVVGTPSCDEEVMDLIDLVDLPAAAPTDPGAVTFDGAPSIDGLRFATPAVIDCRVPVVATLLQALVGECDGTMRDASYRASRDPDSERAPGSLRPARRDRTGQDQLSSCAGIPTEGGDGTGGVSPSQPLALALSATPDMPRFQGTRFADGVTFSLPFRQPRLLERPPRT